MLHLISSVDRKKATQAELERNLKEVLDWSAAKLVSSSKIEANYTPKSGHRVSQINH